MSNIMFPGRENYVGLTMGYFGLLHHNVLFEHSHDVMERVNFVIREKVKDEISIRLYNMIHLDLLLVPAVTKRKPLDADYKDKCKLLDADYEAKRNSLDEDYEAKYKPLYEDYKDKCIYLYENYKAKCKSLDAEILAFIRKHIPDCAWDEKKKMLIF